MSLLKRIFFYLIAVVALTVVYAHHYLIRRTSRRQDFKQTKLGRWNRVKLGKRASASDGSSYYLNTRKGDSRNLLVFFSGGGACWDWETASLPLSLRTYLKHGKFGYYMGRIPFYVLGMHGGIFDRRPDNPFSEWNIVFIPYTTGDFHIGNSITDYVKENGSSTRRVMHNGRNNIEEAMEWIYRNFESPDKVMIAGSSAGGFGSAFWASDIANHYTKSEIYHLSDSSFMESNRWPAIVDDNWKADFVRNFSYPMEADMIGAAFIANGRLMPANAVLIHTCTVYDKVLSSFQNKINGKGDEVDRQSSEAWSQQLRASMRRLAEQLPNFHYFLTDHEYDEKTHSTPHTLVIMKAYYEAKEEGIKLCNWLDGIIHKNDRSSLGSRFLKTEVTEVSKINEINKR